MVGASRIYPLLRFVTTAALYAFLAAVVLNGSPLSEVIHIELYPIYLPVQGREQNPPLLEWGILALVVMTLAWVVVLKRPAAVSNSYLFKVGVFGVTLLYLSDPLLSTLEPYFFTHRFWPLWMLLTFYLVYLLGDNARWRSTMVDYMVFLVGVQATYAVVFHVLGVNQFYTPNFGARTQGTYINPNTLYPVMLWGGALAFARYAWEPTRALKWFHLACLCLCLLAIWLTYTRSAWLAVGAMCAVLLAAHRKQILKANMAAILLVMALFLLGTLFVRTKGHLMGNPEDRSAWGRLQIWRTAFAIYQQHPVIGHGVMSYRYWQNRFVTPELEQFGPLNVEAKNLFLNFAVEFGTLGVAVLIFSLWHVLRLCGRLLRHELGHEDRAIVLGCYLATIGTIVAGLFDTPVFEPWRLPSSVLMMGTWGLVPGIADKIPSATPVPHFGFSRFARGVMIAVAVGILLLGMWVVVPAFVIFKGSRQVLLEKVQSGAVNTPTRNGAFMPPYVKDLFIASEDGYFYQHRGVDWQALHRALRVNIRNLAFKQGGSTITMQTARYLFLGREKTLSRKVAEILLALEMEKHLSKERILELYLNSARFGLGAEDIGTACRVYFGKTPKELTLGEAAFLAGVLPEPPRVRSELTLEKVWRCQRRALSRLAHFFPTKYSSQQIAQAMQERVVFVWER